MKFPFTLFYFILITFLSAAPLHSQSQTDIESAFQFIKENQSKWNLTDLDIKDLSIIDHYESSNGTSHVIVQQNFRGIKIHNATINVTINPNGKIYTIGAPRFFKKINTITNSSSPTLSAEEAIFFSIPHTKSESRRAPALLNKVSDQSYVFAGENLSKNDIPVNLEYRVNTSGELKLCWLLIINETNNSNWWEMHIDAHTGELVHKYNYLLKCRFDDHPFHRHSTICDSPSPPSAILKKETPQKPSKVSAPNSYRVFPLPGESPLHTTHQIVTDPADPIASPFGWHDIDGNPGADVTITFGNNVHAYQDQNGTDASSGDEPDGGPTLEFDFPYDINNGVDSYTKAATVNLFYVANMAHDFAFHHGFDEPAGNFQFQNYTGTGNGFDQVLAHSQDGYLAGSVNNANFITPADGNPPTLQMFVWDRNVGGGTKFLEISSPSDVAGSYGASSAGLTPDGFGPPPPATPIVGEIVEVKDIKYNPFNTDACEELLNPGELNGKIALIDRGGCTFEDKTIRAQAAGAIAVILCNYDVDPIPLGGSIAPDPTIPTIMIGSADCTTLRIHAGNGLMGSVGIPANPGPEFTDGDFDNGIIIHEYGHGISNRLTNGPMSVGCLDHDEQMGEGWSDFFALVTTVRPGDTGATKRGQGNFVYRKGVDGRGYRNFPYSTDMTINPLTFARLAADQEVHSIGAVWCSMLWDLYWAMVDKYTFDDNLISGNGGNNKAVELVIEGLKQQPCLPGFVDARDAILAADEALNNGENQCLIWEVFARRGLGFYADQKDILEAGDGIASFESEPFCTNALQVKKEVDPKVEAGEAINVKVTITNYKTTAVTGVVLSDELLEGLTFVNGSGSIAGTVQGDLVVFELGDIEPGPSNEVVLTYQLATDPNKSSFSQLYYNCESTAGWLIDSAADNPINWTNSSQTPHTGNRSWKVRAIPDRSRQAIFMNDAHLISGTKPVVRFFHSIRTQPGVDGGIVQVSTDEEAEIWFDQESNLLRNVYNSPLDYQTFAIPNQAGFSGNSGGFIESYVDLSAFQGEELRLRFDLATDDNVSPPDAFWAVDDIEFMDMVNYDGEVRVTSMEGDNITASAADIGTVIIGENVSTDDPESSSLDFTIFPNPADEQINVSIRSEDSRRVHLSVLTIEGRLVMSHQTKVESSAQNVRMDVSDLAPGFYFLKASSGNSSSVKKMVIN